MPGPNTSTITLLILQFLSSCALYGQTNLLFSESFDTWGTAPDCPTAWQCGAIPACTPFGGCYWNRNDQLPPLNAPLENGCDGQGYYARVNTSQMFPGEIAYLNSPIFDLELTDPTQLLFLNFCYTNLTYSQLDADVDTLRVYFSNDGGSQWTLVDSTFSPNKAWASRMVEIPTIFRSSQFQMRFTATGQSGTGDMGIDEVQLLEVSAACTAHPSVLSPVGLNEYICKDEVADPFFFQADTSGQEYVYLLLNDQDEIIDQRMDGQWELNELAAGTYQVQGVSYAGGIDIPIGEPVSNLNSVICHLFSANTLEFEVIAIQGQASILSDYQGYSVSQYGGSDGQAQVLVEGGLNNFEIEWESQPKRYGETLLDLKAGSYPIVATDASGCQWRDTLSLTEPSLLEVAVEVNQQFGTYHLRCAEDTDANLLAQVSGGVAPYSYDWIGQVGEDEANLSNLGVGTYTLRVEDANGATQEFSYELLSPPALALNSDIEEISCGGAGDGSISLTPSGGVAPYLYVWQDGNPAAARTNLTGGTYAITVTDQQGCVTTDSFELFEAEPLAVETMLEAPTCAGDSNLWTSLEVSGGIAPYGIQWSNGATDAALFDLIPGAAYEATITDQQGCEVRSRVEVPNPDSLSIEFVVEEVDGDLPGSIAAQIKGGYAPYQLTWRHGPTDSLITVLSVGRYQLTVVDAGGCVISDSIQLGRKANASCLEVHTAFSPNGDGVNETWFIPCLENLAENELSIINRWGQEIFHTENYDNNWGGTIDGKPLPAGTYFYALTFRQGNVRRLVKGTVTLFR
ncbi:MAG: gliding motility-associated C-terminal domain-containing protein [Bacteroidota bacterium]